MRTPPLVVLMLTFAPPPFNDEQPDDEESPRPQDSQQNQNLPIRGSAFATFPQPQPQTPPPLQRETTFAAPPFGAPAGVSTPGMVVPAPEPTVPRNTDR